MPYSSVPPSELTLRDVLARDRTALANERTLLAYVRTGLMLAVSGVTLLKISGSPGLWTWAASSLLVIAGVVISIVGSARCVRQRSALSRIRQS